MNTPLIKKGWLRALIFLLVWLMIQVGVMAVIYKLLLPVTNGAGQQPDPALKLLIISGISCLVNLPAVFFFRKLVDRKTIKSLGFRFFNYEGHALTGLLAALFVLSAGTLIFIGFGFLHFVDLQFYPKDLMLYALIMLLVAVSEETIVRGYILNNLLDSFPKWVALVISALLFALLHLLNPDFNWLGMLGIFTGGLLLGLNYIYTRNLWFGMALHFAWNFLQGPIFGYKVSGLETDPLLVQSINGPAWFTGGPFGFEASLLSSLLICPVIVYLFFKYSRNERALSLQQATD